MPDTSKADDDLDAAFDELAADLKAVSMQPLVTRNELVDDLKAINLLAPWAGDGFFPTDEDDGLDETRPRATLPRQ